MKYLSLVCLLICFLFFACNKENTDDEALGQDCIFEQNDDDKDGLIDDAERSIMNECMDNQFTTKSEIEENLIGEWQLIGHGEGWVTTLSQPCAYLTISEEELILEFKNATIDTTFTDTWEIEEVNWSSDFIFILSNPSHVGLEITHFCSNYMFGNATPLDGNMYLYEKVN